MKGVRWFMAPKKHLSVPRAAAKDGRSTPAAVSEEILKRNSITILQGGDGEEPDLEV